MTLLNSPQRLWWLMAAFTGAWFLSFVYFPGLYLFMGVNHMGRWFLDTYAILASNDALSLGRDPWAYNPLDPLGRPHVYSHWWLHLRDLGLTREHNFWLGMTLVGGFLAAALARLRPRTPGELMWYLAVLCSSSIVLAMDRANNDLAVFAVLAPVVPCLLSERAGVRLIAAALIAVAAGLKFYPAIAGLVLLAGADTRDVRRQVLAGALVLAVVGVNVAPDVVKFAPVAPKAEGIMTFGAGNLFGALGLSGRALTLAVVLAGAAAAWAAWRTRPFAGWTIAREERGTWWSFVLGAVLLTGCFFAGTNFAYRWVFALWLAPLLWRLPRDVAAPAGVRRLARWTRGLLVFALWADPALSALLAHLTGRGVPFATLERWAAIFFKCEQPVIWALFVCLLVFIAHFMREGLQTLRGGPGLSGGATAPSAR